MEFYAPNMPQKHQHYMYIYILYILTRPGSKRIKYNSYGINKDIKGSLSNAFDYI